MANISGYPWSLQSVLVGQEKQGRHSVQNTLINQKRTIQMMRFSPIAFDRRIYGFTYNVTVSSFQN